ncbi:MAG: four helix bundle protein [Alphaproteobacteria bacterium]|nr:four helix bundle protein [Alphaproteobacteria bacterium]
MDNAIKSYRDLFVWQKAMDLAVSCYRLTSEFPKEECYGLTAQIRRAAASIAANIAEGQGREQTKVFIQFLRVAQGSLKEVETHLLLSTRVEIVSTQKSKPLLNDCDELGRMIRALIRTLEAR